MEAVKVLRALVIMEITLLVSTVLLEFMSQDPLPAAVDDYLEGPGAGTLARMAENPSVAVYVLAGLLLMFVGLYIAALVGLLLIKRWARRFYVITFVAGVCLYPFMGVSLLDPISGALEYLLAACSGAILATLFLSDARTHFEQLDAQTRRWSGPGS